MLIMFESKEDVQDVIKEMVTMQVLDFVRKGAIKEGKNMLTPNIIGVYRLKKGPFAGKEIEISWGPTMFTLHPLTGATLIMIGVSTLDGTDPNGPALTIDQLDALLKWAE